jgi:hypothetical protein
LQFGEATQGRVDLDVGVQRLPCVVDHRVHVPRWLQPQLVGVNIPGEVGVVWRPSGAGDALRSGRGRQWRMMPVAAPLVLYLGHCAHVVDVTFFPLRRVSRL